LEPTTIFGRFFLGGKNGSGKTFVVPPIWPCSKVKKLVVRAAKAACAAAAGAWTGKAVDAESIFRPENWGALKFFSNNRSPKYFGAREYFEHFFGRKIVGACKFLVRRNLGRTYFGQKNRSNTFRLKHFCGAQIFEQI
jgi:hypothetical protein